MSLSDYEIMGGIGYGEDKVSQFYYGDPGDIKSLILNEQPVPTAIKRWKPTPDQAWSPFAAGVGLGRPMYTDPYLPVNQEPMGRSYRPDQFGSTKPAINNYEYPAWNPEDPVSGIKFERDAIAGSNSLAVENYFQTETARFGANESINKLMPPDGRQNAYDLISIKEHFGDIANVASNNSNILIILMFIVFIVIAYLQHRQIVKLQKIIGKAVANKI